MRSLRYLPFFSVTSCSLFAYLLLIGGTFWGVLSPQVKVINQLLTLCLLVWMLTGGRWKSLLRFPKAAGLPLLLFAALYLLNPLWSVYPRLSWEASFQRLWYLTIFAIIWCAAASAQRRAALGGALLVGAALEQLDAFIQWILWLTNPNRPPSTELHRPVRGTLNDANDLAIFLAMVAPIWAAAALTERRSVVKGTCWLGLLACLYCLVVTVSRTGTMALLAAALSFAIGLAVCSEGILLRRILLTHWRLPAVMVLALLIGVLTVPGNWFVRRLALMFVNVDLGIFSRLEMWEATWAMVMHKPLLGWGAGCFPLIYLRYAADQTARLTPLHPHSIPLHIAAEVGGVGLGVFAFFVGMMLVCGFRAARREGEGESVLWRIASLSGVMAFLTAAVLGSVWEMPAIMVTFFTLLALALPVQRVEEEVEWSKRRRVLLHAMMLPLLLVGAWAAGIVARWDFAHLAFHRAVTCPNPLERLGWLAEAQRLDPRNAFYHAQAGLLAARLSNAFAAEQNYRMALAAFSGDGLHHHNLAWLLLRRGAKQKALHHFQMATILDPANPLYQAARDAAQESKNVVEAVKRYRAQTQTVRKNFRSHLPIRYRRLGFSETVITDLPLFSTALVRGIRAQRGEHSAP